MKRVIGEPCRAGRSTKLRLQDLRWRHLHRPEVICMCRAWIGGPGPERLPRLPRGPFAAAAADRRRRCRAAIALHLIIFPPTGTHWPLHGKSSWSAPPAPPAAGAAPARIRWIGGRRIRRRRTATARLRQGRNTFSVTNLFRSAMKRSRMFKSTASTLILITFDLNSNLALNSSTKSAQNQPSWWHFLSKFPSGLIQLSSFIVCGSLTLIITTTCSSRRVTAAPESAFFIRQLNFH